MEETDKTHKEASERMTDSSYEIKYGYILYAQIKAAQKRNELRVKLW